MKRSLSRREDCLSILSSGAVILLLLLPTCAAFQTIVTGAISGTVLDPSRAVVPGAAVRLTATLTGTTQAAATDSAGVFTLPFLKPGLYDVSAAHKGFKTTRRTVEVLLGQTVAVKLRLEVGAATEEVEVSATGQLLQTEDANLTTDYQVRQIENLPSPGGDLTNVAQTAPGIVMNTAGGLGTFTAFGLPSVSNLFTINGSDYNDPFLNDNNSGASNLLLGANEIQEVAVVTNGYTGQYGRQAGAQVNYTTKSGANSYHGNASYFLLDRTVDGCERLVQ
jgi:Carboxypeptidase regulatory-like domain/TonB-dependent Receptor Plug Domain